MYSCNAAWVTKSALSIYFIFAKLYLCHSLQLTEVSLLIKCSFRKADKSLVGMKSSMVSYPSSFLVVFKIHCFRKPLHFFHSLPHIYKPMMRKLQLIFISAGLVPFSQITDITSGATYYIHLLSKNNVTFLVV